MPLLGIRFLRIFMMMNASNTPTGYAERERKPIHFMHSKANHKVVRGSAVYLPDAMS